GTLHTYLTYKFALHDEQGVVDSTCAVSMDITERKRMEQALQQEKERAQSYLDLAGVMLVAIEADQTVSLINKKGCELLGYHEEEIIGKNWFDHFIPVMSREQVRQGFAQLIAGNVKEIENFENPVLTRSGQERLIAWHNTVFRDDSGHIVRTFSSGTDITEQRQFENEAAQLMRQLQQSQKMEAIGHLTGGIAHDFNNILTSIMGYTELSRIEAGKIENTRIQNYLNNVTVSSERARDLVAQLLSFSRGVATELKPVEIGKQIQEFLSMLRATFPTTIDLRTEFTCPDVTVNADLVQLNQVLMNLSINARDAMNGHGEIVYGLDQCSGIDAECSSCHQLFAGDYVELSVTDTGDGIDESILSHIFDPFFTTKEVGKGTGMGLAMVHGIVHAHGGHVLVESVVDGGTRFRLFFPSAHQDMKQHLVQEKAGHYHADNITRNLQGHVLLVDDEDMIISYITELLQSCGLDVTTINNSLYALDTFSHDPEQFDMIITDQTMPTMTGVELVARIREIRRDIPVVLMTGHSDEIDQDKVAALNINGFMHKPLEQKSFLLTVAQLLDH
ncbi:MAG: response regulator, partial [Gammaproteobacteria bacterium]